MRKILIVEDDSDIQDIFKIIFSSNGYEVECIDKGLSVAGRKNNLPDLIILDKQLPDVSGTEACKTLKASKETCNIPVIMISAAPGLAAAARDAGADDFIEKPFTMQIILKKVHKLFMQQKTHLRTVN
jgi:DNA-binding response OmpR family regulator